MNRKQVVCIALGTLVALTSLGAQAQSSTAANAAATSAPAMSAADAKAANKKLQKDVIRVLARTKGLSMSNVTVRAKDGVVTLEGGVPDQSQIELAGRAAAGVPGVSSVKNALTLTTF
jgi:hyperosmotically inducible periplasmic protein